MRHEFHSPLLWALRRLVVGMLMAAGWAAAMPTAWADPPGRVGRIAETHGTVWIYSPDQQEWVQAEVNRPLTTGDRLALDHDARAELTIGSTTVRLDADSQLDFTELDDEHMRLQLDQGSLAARLRDAQAAAQFEVVTPQGRFMPQQPGHYRIDIDDDETYALAWSGSLRFDASDSALSVPAGQRAELWQEDGATHYSWAEVPRDDFSDWVLAADQRDELAAARQRYVPLDMTGWEDLDRAGRWESSQTYGVVWIPLQVAPGWAPYRQGHWVWMSPWGWTWVDDAPWGFAPFHYGRWVWWGQRWCWVPGPHHRRVVYAPALVGWVGSSPVYSGVGPAPLVGWVPLAPGESYYPGYEVGSGHWQALNPHDPGKSYRPAPPLRRNANFVNSRAPGAITLIPASNFAQARPTVGVVTREPGDRPGPRAPGDAFQRPGGGTPGARTRPGPSLGGAASGTPLAGLAVVAPPPAPSRLASGPVTAVPAPPNTRRRPPFVRSPAPMPAPRPAPAAPALPSAPAGNRAPGPREDRAVPVTRPAPAQPVQRMQPVQPVQPVQPPPSGAWRPEDRRRTLQPVPHPRPAPAPAEPVPGIEPPMHRPMPASPPPSRVPTPSIPGRPATGAAPPAAPLPPSVVTRIAPQVVTPPPHGAGQTPPGAGRDDRPRKPPGAASNGAERSVPP